MLQKDPMKRLGSIDREELKVQPFFYGLDWEKVAAKSYDPHFIPDLQKLTKRVQAPEENLHEMASKVSDFDFDRLEAAKKVKRREQNEKDRIELEVQKAEEKAKLELVAAKHKMYNDFNLMIQEIQGKHEDQTDKLKEEMAILKEENNLLKGSLNGLQIENNLLQNMLGDVNEVHEEVQDEAHTENLEFIDEDQHQIDLKKFYEVVQKFYDSKGWQHEVQLEFVAQDLKEGSIEAKYRIKCPRCEKKILCMKGFNQRNYATYSIMNFKRHVKKSCK